METSLCQRCQCLDFESLARVELPRSHCITYILGSLSEILIRQESCQFCRLVVCAFAAVWKLKPPPTSVDGLPISCHLSNRAVCVVTAGDDAPSYSENFAANTYQSCNCRITITCDRAPPGCPLSVEIQPIDDEANLRGLFDDAKLFSRRPKNQLMKIDFDLVRKWFSNCSQFHGDLCKRDTSPQNHHANYVSSFRLIDVRRNCIVDAETECSYVALSYVWGQVPMLKLILSNKSDLYEDGALAASCRCFIPQTIQDAIEAVKQLGIRYLWVDALCIVQDDHVEKEAVIGEMDLIYSRAELTLVAAFGNHANAGLPGLLPGTRDVDSFDEKMSFGTKGTLKELVIARSRPSTLIDGSRWNSRGWTYQERLFSHRMLLFTDEQLLFWCGKSSWCEDTVLETDNKHVFNEEIPLFRFGVRNDPSSPFMKQVETSSTISMFKEYSKCVSEYSRRELSFQGDILDAFAGLLRSVKSSYKPDPYPLTFHFGLPSAWFEMSLLWTPLCSSKLRRRDCESSGPFPSWSWTGWVGQVKIECLEGSIRPEVEWYTFDEHGAAFPIKSGERSSPPLPWYLASSTEPRRLREKWRPVGAPVDVRQSGVLGQESYNRSGTHLLMFYSSCAFLPVVAPRAGLLAFARNLRGLPVREYFIVGEHGGSIDLDAEWMASHPAPKYEFVVISRGLGTDWKDPGMLDSLNVMLIERHGQVAYRVGIGHVSEATWADAGSEWKFIQLG